MMPFSSDSKPLNALHIGLYLGLMSALGLRCSGLFLCFAEYSVMTECLVMRDRGLGGSSR